MLELEEVGLHTVFLILRARFNAPRYTRQFSTFLFWVSFISGRSVREFVEACKKATGVSIKVDFLPRRPGDYAEVLADPTKIFRELNWTARHTDLQESLQVAWRWQKSHRKGYGPG